MRIRSILATVLMVVGLTVPATAVLAPSASAERCTGTWSIVVGGFTVHGAGTWQNSGYLHGNRRVEYNSTEPWQGLGNLNAAIWQHRTACRNDHIKLIGHSEGAMIVHVWVTQNQGFSRLNAVLLADPKRSPGPGSGGISSSLPGFGIHVAPWTGTDNWFGNIPVLTVCNRDDVICNTDAGWFGYLTGAHTRYNYSAFSYGNFERGVRFR